MPRAAAGDRWATAGLVQTALVLQRDAQLQHIDLCCRLAVCEAHQQQPLVDTLSASRWHKHRRLERKANKPETPHA